MKISDKSQEKSPMDQAASGAAHAAKTAGSIHSAANMANKGLKSAQAAHAAAGAAKAGAAAATAGTTVGTALGGPFGAVIGKIVTSKTFWKVIGGIFAALLLFMFIIANFFGIILSYLGFLNADDYVMQARNADVANLRIRIEELFKEKENAEDDIAEIIESQRDLLLDGIEADFSDNYTDFETYHVIDEYETKMKDNLPRYLAYLLSEQWSGSQIVTFNGYGKSSSLATELTSSYDAHFEQAAATYNVPAALLKAMGKVESNFNPNAVSGAGAQGIMQLMPGTAASLGVTDPFDPKQNIFGGAKYVASLMDTFTGYPNQLELVIAGYNAGPGAVQKAGYQVPDYAETKAHVQKVMSYLTDTGNAESDTAEADWNLMYSMLYDTVEENANNMFGWSVTDKTERSQEVKYYMESSGVSLEISQKDYNSYIEQGITTIYEKEIIKKSKIEYTVALKLTGLQSDEGEFGYRFITSETLFNTAIQLLKLLEDGIDWAKQMLFQMFNWTDLVFGSGTGDSYISGIDVSGDIIRYDTVAGCVGYCVYFNQTEEPWASMPYSSSTIRASGCGPTSLAIVISTLTGQSVTPQTLCNYAANNGYYVPGAGTSHAFIGQVPQQYGLNVQRVNKSQMSEITRALKEGKMVVEICAGNTITGSGSGHFIVLTGVTGSGNITIADPASRERTGKEYSVGTIQSYARSDVDAFWIIGREAIGN